jgi:glucose/arabinose dehydrogenase
MKLKPSARIVLSFTLLLPLSVSVTRAALAEFDASLGTIEAPDGSFTGRDFTVARDFKLELLYVVADNQGSWLPMTWDPQGRLLVASHNSNDLFQLTIPQVGSTNEVRVERIAAGLEIGAAHGLLQLDGALYINVDEGGGSGGGGGGGAVGRRRNGLYRITDSNSDGTWDNVAVIRNISGSGQHGTHSLKLSPDGRSIFMISGDDTPLTVVERSRVPMIWGEDDLLRSIPPNFNDYQLAPQGWTVRIDPVAEEYELWSIGMRNAVDQAFNKDGEWFTYDSDMEADKGNSFYRPTSVYHLTSGADFGYRLRSSKRPRYYIDNLDTVAAIGSGSPTGVYAGTGSKFPERFQDSLFISDWSYGNLWAVLLTPQGATYTGEPIPFVSGRPFSVTGSLVNPADGSMLILTGGNGQSQLYRISYTGNESTAPTQPDTSMAASRATRRVLEQFHGRADPSAVNSLWPYLADADRVIRYAARTALEWQPVAGWRDRALAESEPRRLIAAMVALARLSGKDEYHRSPSDPAPNKALQARMIAALNRVDWNTISYQDKLDLLRAYSLVFTRLGEPDNPTREALIAKFDPLLPATQRELNWELAEMLVYLGAPSAPTKILALMREAPSMPFYPLREYINPLMRQRGNPGVSGPTVPNNFILARQEDQEQYALVLRVARNGWTPELRQEYFSLFPTIAEAAFGGVAAHLGTIRVDALAQVPEAERAALGDLPTTPLNTGGRGGRGGPGGAGGRGSTGTPGIGAPGIDLYQAGVAGTRGRGNLYLFNDLEWTAITRMEQTIEPQIAAAVGAREAMLRASLSGSPAPTELAALARSLSDAELALAEARAEAFPRLVTALRLSPDRIQNLSTVLNR